MTLWRFLDELIKRFDRKLELDSKRNELMQKGLDTPVQLEINDAELFEDVKRAADALEQIADTIAHEGHGDGELVLGTRVGPSEQDPSKAQGGAPVSLALIQSNTQRTRIGIADELTDRDGAVIVGPDGQPWKPTSQRLETENGTIVPVNPVDPAKDGGDVRDWFIRAGKAVTGQAQVTQFIPMPDGTEARVPILTTITNSGLNDSASVIRGTEEDPDNI